jgi:hypothetical protein
MGGRFLTAGLAGLAISGCTTTSFAPPEIEMGYVMDSVQPGTCTVQAAEGASEITPDVAGANLLIDNFLAGYKCASREASNGRQSFEVPSFLALIAAGIGGPLYGFSRNEQLAAGAYSAVMGRANSYYAPKEKADLLRAAISGVTCIGNAAVGYDYFDADAEDEGGARNAVAGTTQDEKLVSLVKDQLADITARLQVAGLAAAERRELVERRKELDDLLLGLTKRMDRARQAAAVEIDADYAYFRLVRHALIDVDTVLEKRMSDSGTFDPASLSGELENLTRQEIAAETDERALDDPAKMTLYGADGVENRKINLELEQLHARLQKCVVRAKMT